MNRKWTITLGALVIGIFMFGDAQAQRLRHSRLKPVNFTFDVMPLGLINMPNIDDVRLSSLGLGLSEEISGSDSATGSLNLGVNFDTPAVLIDLTAGAGAVVHDRLDCGLFQAKVGARVKLGSHHVTLGPHLGVHRFRNIEWDGRANVDISNASGNFVGVGFSAGGKACSFFANVDWMEAEADMVTRNGWTVSTDSNGDAAPGSTVGELDLSGVRVQFGIVFRF